MRESETYMGILEEGAIAELKKMILRLGHKSFGVPNESIDAELTAIAAREELERLEHLLERIHEVKSWQELMETP